MARSLRSNAAKQQAQCQLFRQSKLLDRFPIVRVVWSKFVSAVMHLVQRQRRLVKYL